MDLDRRFRRTRTGVVARLLGTLLVATLPAAACSSGSPGPVVTTPSSVGAPSSPSGSVPATGRSPSAGTAPSAPSAPHCTAAQLRFTVLGTNGAAGTIADAVRLTNTAAADCWTYGYVGLTIIDRDGRRLPTRTVRGIPPAIVPGTPGRVSLPAGGWAWFALAYHDVSPTVCADPPAAGVRLAIIAPDTAQSGDVSLRTDAACGEIGVSPILPASEWHGSDWAAP